MQLTPDIHLLPQSAVLLQGATLILADIHLGKSATFRARGLPVPEGDNERDLTRILNLVHETHARHLIIAGDLFHAPSGIDSTLSQTLNDFLANLSIPLTLVSGNHDAKLKHLPAGLTTVPHLDLGNIRVIHDPADSSSDHFNITGHWHPVIKIPDGKRTSLRLPCFLLRGNTLVLPSFGTFTGGRIIQPEPGDRFFVTLRDQIAELPPGIA